MGAVEAEAREEAVKSPRERGGRRGLGQRRRLAESGKVDGDHGSLGREGLEHGIPHPPVAPERMDEDEWGSEPLHIMGEYRDRGRRRFAAVAENARHRHHANVRDPGRHRITTGRRSPPDRITAGRRGSSSGSPLAGAGARRGSRSAPNRTYRRAGEPVAVSTSRLEAFSDGVIAVAITPLVLNIRVPPVTEHNLGHQLVRNWPQYAAYVISFITIGIIWINHHAMIGRLQRPNHAILFLNLLLLMSIGILPFARLAICAAVAAFYALPRASGSDG
jgi:hypothetical protein